MKKLIYIIFITFMLTSCLGTKKIFDKNTNTKSTETTETIKDSTSNKITSLPIKDKLVINVPKSDNKEVMAMFEVLMKQLNTSKSSGSNSYVSRYDSENNRLIIEYLIASTQNSKTVVNNDSKIEKSFEEQTDEYVSKKITALPWWAYLIGVWLLRSHIIGIISVFVPGVRNIKSISDLLNPPEKE